MNSRDKAELGLRLLKHMHRIRAVEEEIAERYPEGRMRCPTHLSTGQEAVPAALAECLLSSDFAVSTHRGHAHYLAKGGNLNAMIAEIYGKASGCSRGKGGSMHLVDLQAGFMGTSAIVGNSIPIGVGLALAAHYKGTDQVSCVFFGDGATEEGVYYESLNFAALRGLPVLFVCENNLYSVYSSIKSRQPADRSIAGVAKSMGLKTVQGDGNDALAAYEDCAHVLADIRAGGGPWLVEYSVYRWREHCGPNYDDDLAYRPAEELQRAKRREPISLLRRQLATGVPNLDELESAILREIRDEVDAAFHFAEISLFPSADEAFTGEYA
ncbi:MAG: thiamine pyrophosphate-dependent dehydrogenase E1 component subunit alpha [Luminiphilus sp.]